MRYSILLVAFSALALAQSSQPVIPTTTSQPLIPTGAAPTGASSSAVSSSSTLTTSTSTRQQQSTSTSDSSSTETASATPDSTTNGAFPIATAGSLGLSAGLAGAALAALL